MGTYWEVVFEITLQKAADQKAAFFCFKNKVAVNRKYYLQKNILTLS